MEKKDTRYCGICGNLTAIDGQVAVCPNAIYGKWDLKPVNMIFLDNNGTEVGKFEYDLEAKRWTFTGNMDEAAKKFAQFMYAHFQSILEGDRDGILTSQVDDPDKWDPPLEPAEEPLKINTIPLHKLPPYGSAV